MGFTCPGRCPRAVLSPGGEGEVTLLPSPPTSHLHTCLLPGPSPFCLCTRICTSN